jgi:hypothetical protein
MVVMNETMMGLVQAAASVPPLRDNRPVAPATIGLWITRGCRGPAGQIVRLEGIRCGSRWVTSKEALARFFSALTPSLSQSESSVSETTSPKTSTPRQRRRATACA